MPTVPPPHVSAIVKGPVQKSGGDRAEHIDREPPCNGQLNELMSSCCTVDFPTHSILQPLPRPPKYTTLKAEFDEKKAEAVGAFDQIVQACEASGNKKFFDKEFFIGSRTALYPDGSPDDCTVGEPETIIRAEDFYQGAPIFDGSGNGDVDAEDVVQGTTGDCFWIGAVSGIATYTKRFAEAREKNPSLPDNFTGCEDPIQRLFVASDTNKSVYAIMFYANGAWEWVIVDGTLAGRGNGSPLYATCGEKERELWPVILEKAFAKFHKSFDAMDGGWSRQAIATMTGGVELKIDNDPSKTMKWKKFLELGSNPMNVMGCSVRDEIEADEDGETGRCGEESGPKGLIKGHAYTVLDVKETSDGKGFVKCRNPWSSGEWTGDWSDKSKLWKKFPQLAKELGHVSKDDGCFWMSAGDFKKYMELEAVNFFPDTNQILSFSNKFATKKPADDIFILKIDAPVTIRFILGQYQTRFVPALLGLTETNHKILKRSEEWDQTACQLKLTVNHHNRGCPVPKGFETSHKRKIAYKEMVWGEVVFTDVDCPQGYISVEVNLETNRYEPATGIPYYLRAVAPPSAQITAFPLSKGVEGALGFTEGVEIKREKPKPKPAADGEEAPKPKPPPREDGEEPAAVDEEEEEEEDYDWEEWDEEEEEEGDWSEYEDSFYGEFDEEDDFWNDCDWDDMEGEEGWDDEDEEEEGECEGGAGGDDSSSGLLRPLFDQFDIDGNGTLDKSEATAALVHFFPDASPREITQKIREADLNGDGKLSFGEFKRIAEEACMGDDDDDDEDYEDYGDDY